VATVTSAPAAATGLADRGRIEIGARADVIRVKRIGQAASVRGTWVQGVRVA
jgi:alpha-D-ribose 1-methylphosphonate 5-triphosphate diphosphatase